jgi:hypothetical protein
MGVRNGAEFIAGLNAHPKTSGSPDGKSVT